jgi:hypothetical protein
MHLFSWESPIFGTEFFVIHPLTLVVAISQENLNPLTLGGDSHTFACSLTWETWFHPRQGCSGVSRRWSVSPSASWGRSEFESRFWPVWWAVLPPLLVLAPHWVPLCIRGPRPDSLEDEFKLSVGAWWDPPGGPGHAPQQQGRWKISISTILANELPRNAAGISSWDMEYWGSLAGSSVYCAGTDPADWCPKAEPWEQRGRTL